jgi:hypothetical protein
MEYDWVSSVYKIELVMSRYRNVAAFEWIVGHSENGGGTGLARDSPFMARNPLRTSKRLKGPATGDWPLAWLPSRRKPLRGRAAFTATGAPDAARSLRTSH